MTVHAMAPQRLERPLCLGASFERAGASAHLEKPYGKRTQRLFGGANGDEEEWVQQCKCYLRMVDKEQKM